MIAKRVWLVNQVKGGGHHNILFEYGGLTRLKMEMSGHSYPDQDVSFIHCYSGISVFVVVLLVLGMKCREQGKVK